MISFFINIFKLLKAVIVGIKDDQEFRILLFLLIPMLIGSTFFTQALKAGVRLTHYIFQ